MLSYRKAALFSLNSMVTSPLLPASVFFSRFKGFLGTMKLAAFGDCTSVRLYRTSLCASVATKRTSSSVSSKKIPLITGRRSSLPVANMVLLIAFASVPPGSVRLAAPSSTGLLGNSAPLKPVILYLPCSLLISTPWCLPSMLKVSGCSGKAFSVSSRMRAGIATLPLSLASTGMVAVMVVSRSLAVRVSCLPSISRRKLSRIGRVLLLARTPWRSCNCLSKAPLETMNFIGKSWAFSGTGKAIR